MPNELFATEWDPNSIRSTGLVRTSSQSSSHSSGDDENLYDCGLASFVHQFNFTRTETEALTLDDCLAGGDDAEMTKFRNSILIDSPAQGEMSDLSDFLSELENLDFGAYKPRRPSRLSMVLVDDPKDDQPLSQLAPKPKKDSAVDEAKLEAAKKKIQSANLKKVTAKIYLESAGNSQIVQLTSLSTPELVIEGFIEKGKLAENVEWVVTEIHESYGVSRALKPWEPILEVIEPWESDCHSALLIKPRQGELLTPEVSKEAPLMAGWLQVQVRKGKWEKKFAVLKRATLYLGKNESMVGASAICTMQNFEAFTTTRAPLKAPKRPLFALKSQQSIMLFEKPDEDYIHFFACESETVREHWFRALRHSRSWVQYSSYLQRPSLFSPFSDSSLPMDSITGLHLDDGQFDELDNPKANGSSTLTKNTAGGIAGRLFRLVLTGDQGKTDIDRVIGTKALPNVFAEGSLLSKPTRPEESELTSSSTEEEVFKEGSLLSKGPSRGGIRKDSSPTAMEFQANSLLTALKPCTKSQPLSITTKSGPLLHLHDKDADVFQNGTLLNTPQQQNFPLSPRAPNSVQPVVMSPRRIVSPTSPNNTDLPRSPSITSRQKPQRSATGGPLLGMTYSATKAHPTGSHLHNGNSSSNDNTPLHISSKNSSFSRKPPASPSRGVTRSTSILTNPTPPTSEPLFAQGSLLSKPLTRRGTAPTQHHHHTTTHPNPPGPLLQLSGNKEQRHTSQIKKQNLKPLISFK